MSEPAVYQIRLLQKAYGSRVVLNIDELDVYSGEILAILGPSGAGKSTMLRLLNFLEAPSSGGFDFQGQLYDSQNPAPLEVRRRVTTVFQRPVLLSRSVLDNVAIGLGLRGVRENLGQTRKALEQVGMSEFAGQDARRLSGGEAQRVALARAMVLEPAVLLLDEPTANLDPYNASLVEQIIRQANQERGTTVILVTHNIFQARRLAHRTAFLLSGSIVETSATQDFFQSPADTRTLAFLNGDMVY